MYHNGFVSFTLVAIFFFSSQNNYLKLQQCIKRVFKYGQILSFSKKEINGMMKIMHFFTMSVFAMFSSLIGIANTDQIISSVFKKPWLSAVPLQAFQMEMHRNDQKKISDLVFEVLLPFVL